MTGICEAALGADLNDRQAGLPQQRARFGQT
jgi:hypothetical protein